jgi:RimJ/RimL family protein N-acetyltransferase
MEIKVMKAGLKEVQAFRVLFLHESNFQFVHNKCHLYGWADTWLFLLNDIAIGYGAVWGQSKREDRDAIFEFYIINPYKKFASAIFSKFHALSGAAYVECQSNELLLSSMLYEYAKNINAEAILFEDYFTTDFAIPGAVLHKRTAEDNNHRDDRPYILKQDDNVVATGGLMLNYNMPYADLYYEVNEGYRQKGFGSLMVQELKKEAYHMGRVPSARCNIQNSISKATLLKAGFKVCGFILKGEIKREKE